MNPQQVFQSSLFGQSSPMMTPSTSSSLFSGPSGAFSPKASYVSSLSTPSGPQSLLPSAPVSSTGGNAAATSPKAAYVNSQTGSTGSTAPTTPTSNFTTPSGAVVNSSGQTLSGPTSGAGAQPQALTDYQQAFQTYLASLQPSSAETDAEKALAAQTLQSQKDQDFALNRPGETLGFASGEAARVAHNNAFQTDALSNTVNSLTGARTARTTAAQANLDFEKGLYSDYQTANKPKDNVTVSPGSTIFDPNTGKAVYTAPTTSSQDSTGSAGASQLTPYLSTSGNGQQYVDLSSVTGADKNKLAQLAGANGIHVITSANESADLTNIQNAYLNLDTIAQSFQGLTSPNAIERNLAGVGLGAVSSLFQTNAQDTAATALNDSALDLLKSISGVQGFRGNQGAIDQIRDNLPTIYDTSEVATQKLANVKALIQNRESALLKSSSSTGASTDISGGSDYQAYLKAIGQ